MTLLSHMIIAMTVSFGFAQDFAPKKTERQKLHPLKITATYLAIESLPIGSNSSLRLDFDLDPDFHAYLDQFKLEALDPPGVQISQIQISPEVEFFDTISKKMKKGVRNKAVLNTVIGIPQTFPLGNVKATFELTYQACTTKFCLLPKKIQIPVEFNVVAEKDQVVHPQNSSIRHDSILEQVKKRGWALVFITIFFAGILTSFTPCVLPMIPITLAVIGSTNQKHGRWRNLAVTLIYILGMAFSYSILGLIAAITGSLFGSLLGHPLVAIGFALLFFLMALGAFGFFEIQAPLFIRKRLGTYQMKNRSLGAFVSGLLAGVVAGPCVGPILVSILAFVAQHQDPVLGFFMLFTFALGMGQLFLLLGLSTHWIQKIPRNGKWMNFTRFVFGGSLLVLSFYYLYPVAVRFLKPASPTFLNSLGNKNQHNSMDQWKIYSENQVEEALEKNQPIIIDFYADWCAACKELEEKTFSHPQVIEKTKNFILLRMDCTQSSPAFEKLQKQFQIQGLPTVIFHDGKKWREDLTLTGFENAEAFLKRIHF